MIRSLNTAVLGIKQFQTSLDAIGNNLANINTVAYKGARVDFSDTLAQTLRAPTPDTAAASGTAGMQLGNGVKVASIKNEFTQGAIKQTGVRTDLAITGEGFFLVRDPFTDQMYATRAGDFREDKNGYLVTNDGYRVLGKPNMAPAYDISIKEKPGDIQLDVGLYTKDRLGVTVDAATDIFTKTDHGYTTGTQVKFGRDSSLTPLEQSALTADQYLPYVTQTVDAGGNEASKKQVTDSDVFFVATHATDATKFTLHNSAADAAAGTNAVNFNTDLTTGLTLKGGGSISSYSVGADGKVNMLLTDGTQYVRGQIFLQNFKNPQALLKQGSNLYSNLATAGPIGVTDSSVNDTMIKDNAQEPGSSGVGRIAAGALELSNVDMAREFSNMITTQRAFQANARMVTTSDEILKEMMALKR